MSYGHAPHFVVLPGADGERAALVPIFGEAACSTDYPVCSIGAAGASGGIFAGGRRAVAPSSRDSASQSVKHWIWACTSTWPPASYSISR